MLKAQLRRLALSRQGLASSRPFGRGPAAAQRAIEHLGYVQIDTLSVIERSHHHVLWTRIPDYRPEHLNQLLSARGIFEYWFHAASYLPMRDYRYSLPKMLSIKSGTNRYFSNVSPRLMREIHDRVRIDGPLRVRDLETGKKEQGSWWNWGPGKRAVEKLFMQGDLMVRERNGMEKIYDLAERVLPRGLNLQEPSLEELAAHLVDGALRAHGCVTWKQLVHLRTGERLRAALRNAIEERIASRRIMAVKAEDIPAAYVDSEALDQLPRVASALRILSPFDNVVIHRERLNDLFGFNYRLECYTPAEKRIFGYFCLPVLFGEKFVGRVDCKAHRGEQRLEVLSLYLEDESVDQEDFASDFERTVRKLAAFNGCSSVEICRARPRSLLQQIRRQLRGASAA